MTTANKQTVAYDADKQIYVGIKETIDSQVILVQQLKTCNKVDIREHLR
jgi:hypothetical protein